MPHPDPADYDLPIEWLPLAGAAEQLIVLLHGWSDDAMTMAPLAQALRSAFPQAAVLVPESPLPCDRPLRGGRRGRQWYSIDGITAANGVQRLEPVLARLVPWLRRQQQRLGVGEAATALGGFSQGAILALEMVLRHAGIAGRVLAFGSKLPRLPHEAPALTTLHFLHGEDDRVFPALEAREAFDHIAALRGDATLDIASGVGHELHPALVDCALHRLKSHIPLRTWQAALGAAPR
jgi:phospholipase/carboxylesterase